MGSGRSQGLIAAACVFCGAGGKLTEEHVFPQWLRRLVDLQVHERWLSTTEMSTDSRTDPERVAGSVYALRPRIACAPCNNGWMSALEERARPLVSPMVEGRGGGLTAAEVDVVTAWAQKTAMTAQWTLPGMITYTQAHRQAFASGPAPLQRTRAWIGRYTEDKGGDLWQYPWTFVRDRVQTRRRRTPTSPSWPLATCS